MQLSRVQSEAFTEMLRVQGQLLGILLSAEDPRILTIGQAEVRAGAGAGEERVKSACMSDQVSVPGDYRRPMEGRGKKESTGRAWGTGLTKPSPRVLRSATVMYCNKHDQSLSLLSAPLTICFLLKKKRKKNLVL